jgi:hypothetical protein
MMRQAVTFALGLIVAVMLPSTLCAQRTGDQARLVFTVSGGAVTGQQLWSIASQPLHFTTTADTLDLGRRIRSTLAIGFGGAYFPGTSFGLTLEGFLLGLGFEDSCNQAFSSGSPSVSAVCSSIQGTSRAATAVALTAGTIFRINSRKPLSPYGRVNAGLIFSNQSSVRMMGQYQTATGPADLVVYADEKSSRVDPGLALGLGVTAAISKSYNLRWEIRDNIVGIHRVTAATPQAGIPPPIERTYKHLFSVTLGFDVVLERRRGRRY